MKQQRIQQAASNIAASTPPSSKLGGRPVAPESLSEAAAQAAHRRSNHALKASLDKAVAERAAAAAAEARARDEAQQAQARARDANASRAAADAAAAQQQQRAAWAGSPAVREALAMLLAHPSNAPPRRGVVCAQLIQLLVKICHNPLDPKYRRLNPHAPAFPNAHGALVLLQALGFEYDDAVQRFVLRDGYSAPLLAETAGQLRDRAG